MRSIINLIRQSKDLTQNKLFRDNYTVAFLYEIGVTLCALLDGMICSAFYGSTGVAAIGLLNPYFSLMGMLSAFLIIGTQKTYVNALCKGNQEKAVEAFSSSCIAAIFLAVTISTLCVVFATPIVRFLGATNESPTLQSYGRQYLYSLAFGSPFSVLTPHINPNRTALR